MLNVAKWQSGVVANDISPTVFHFGTKTHYPLLVYMRPSYTSSTLPRVIPTAGQKQSQPGTNIFPLWD